MNMSMLKSSYKLNLERHFLSGWLTLALSQSRCDFISTFDMLCSNNSFFILWRESSISFIKLFVQVAMVSQHKKFGCSGECHKVSKFWTWLYDKKANPISWHTCLVFPFTLGGLRWHNLKHGDLRDTPRDCLKFLRKRRRAFSKATHADCVCNAADILHPGKLG